MVWQGPLELEPDSADTVAARPDLEDADAEASSGIPSPGLLCSELWPPLGKPQQAMPSKGSSVESCHALFCLGTLLWGVGNLQP